MEQVSRVAAFRDAISSLLHPASTQSLAAAADAARGQIARMDASYDGYRESQTPALTEEDEQEAGSRATRSIRDFLANAARDERDIDVTYSSLPSSITDRRSESAPERAVSSRLSASSSLAHPRADAHTREEAHSPRQTRAGSMTGAVYEPIASTRVDRSEIAARTASYLAGASRLGTDAARAHTHTRTHDGARRYDQEAVHADDSRPSTSQALTADVDEGLISRVVAEMTAQKASFLSSIHALEQRRTHAEARMESQTQALQQAQVRIAGLEQRLRVVTRERDDAVSHVDVLSREARAQMHTMEALRAALRESEAGHARTVEQLMVELGERAAAATAATHRADEAERQAHACAVRVSELETQIADEQKRREARRAARKLSHSSSARTEDASSAATRSTPRLAPVPAVSPPRPPIAATGPAGAAQQSSPPALRDMLLTSPRILSVFREHVDTNAAHVPQQTGVHAQLRNEDFPPDVVLSLQQRLNDLTSAMTLRDAELSALKQQLASTSVSSTAAVTPAASAVVAAPAPSTNASTNAVVARSLKYSPHALERMRPASSMSDPQPAPSLAAPQAKSPVSRKLPLARAPAPMARTSAPSRPVVESALAPSAAVVSQHWAPTIISQDAPAAHHEPQQQQPAGVHVEHIRRTAEPSDDDLASALLPSAASATVSLHLTPEMSARLLQLLDGRANDGVTADEAPRQPVAAEHALPPAGVKFSATTQSTQLSSESDTSSTDTSHGAYEVPLQLAIERPQPTNPWANPPKGATARADSFAPPSAAAVSLMRQRPPSSGARELKLHPHPSGTRSLGTVTPDTSSASLLLQSISRLLQDDGSPTRVQRSRSSLTVASADDDLGMLSPAWSV